MNLKEQYDYVIKTEAALRCSFEYAYERCLLKGGEPTLDLLKAFATSFSQDRYAELKRKGILVV